MLEARKKMPNSKYHDQLHYKTTKKCKSHLYYYKYYEIILHYVGLILLSLLPISSLQGLGVRGVCVQGQVLPLRSSPRNTITALNVEIHA